MKHPGDRKPLASREGQWCHWKSKHFSDFPHPPPALCGPKLPQLLIIL